MKWNSKYMSFYSIASDNFRSSQRSFLIGASIVGGLTLAACNSNPAPTESAGAAAAKPEVADDVRKEEETRGNRRATPEAYFEAGELVVKGPAVDLMIFGIGEARLYVPSDASKDVVWYWQNSLKPVPGEPALATLRQPLASPPSGLAYLELSWSEKDGSAFKRIPVQFPVQ
jgi:hypothetical protein